MICAFDCWLCDFKNLTHVKFARPLPHTALGLVGSDMGQKVENLCYMSCNVFIYVNDKPSQFCHIITLQTTCVILQALMVWGHAYWAYLFKDYII